MSNAFKVISALGALTSYFFLVKYFVQALGSNQHPSGPISTAIVMLLAEIFMVCMVLIRVQPHFKWFPILALIFWYGIFILCIYSFYRDGYGLFLAFVSLVFRIISLYSSPLTAGEGKAYIVNHVYLFLLTIVPVFLGSKYIVKALPFLKAKFPAGDGEVNTSIINLSEAVLIWAVVFFSLAGIYDVYGALKSFGKGSKKY